VTFTTDVRSLNFCVETDILKTYKSVMPVSGKSEKQLRGSHEESTVTFHFHDAEV